MGLVLKQWRCWMARAMLSSWIHGCSIETRKDLSWYWRQLQLWQEPLVSHSVPTIPSGSRCVSGWTCTRRVARAKLLIVGEQTDRLSEPRHGMLEGPDVQSSMRKMNVVPVPDSKFPRSRLSYDVRSKGAGARRRHREVWERSNVE